MVQQNYIKNDLDFGIILEREKKKSYSQIIWKAHNPLPH